MFEHRIHVFLQLDAVSRDHYDEHSERKPHLQYVFRCFTSSIQISDGVLLYDRWSIHQEYGEFRYRNF